METFFNQTRWWATYIKKKKKRGRALTNTCINTTKIMLQTIRLTYDKGWKRPKQSKHNTPSKGEEVGDSSSPGQTQKSNSSLPSSKALAKSWETPPNTRLLQWIHKVQAQRMTRELRPHWALFWDANMLF